MTSTRNNNVKVQLRVFKSLECYPGAANDHFVAVVGPGIQLGNDDPTIAPRCKPIGRNFWEKELWLPKDSFVDYKFLVIRSCTGKVVDIESITPHNIYIGQQPIMVEHTYNKTAFAGREVYPQHSRPKSSVNRKETFHVTGHKTLCADKVGFVVPKIKNPPKYVPPQNIGLIHCKRMIPAKVEADDEEAVSYALLPSSQNNNCIMYTTEKSSNQCLCATERINTVAIATENNTPRAKESNKVPNATVNNNAEYATESNNAQLAEESNKVPNASVNNNAEYATESNNAKRATESDKVPNATVNNNAEYATESNNAQHAEETNKAPYATVHNDTKHASESNKTKYTTESNNAPWATESSNVACDAKKNSNSSCVSETENMTGNDVNPEKGSTEPVEDVTLNELSNNACQFRFGKKPIVLAVSGISLISAIGYFSFFKR